MCRCLCHSLPIPHQVVTDVTPLHANTQNVYARHAVHVSVRFLLKCSVANRCACMHISARALLFTWLRVPTQGVTDPRRKATRFENCTNMLSKVESKR
eukprot:2486312-Rhodomonas_salina.1